MEPLNFAFLHGGAQGGWVWSETIAALQARSGGVAHCLALDVPGCGTKRDRDTAEIPFDAITEELLGEIAAARMRDVVLVGHSQAGTLFPRLIRAGNGLFKRAVYIACTAPARGDTAIADGDKARGVEQAQLGADARPRERYRAMFCNDMTQPQASALLDQLGHDSWPPSAYTETDWGYEGLDSVPATYILCLRDRAVVPERQERYAVQFRAERIHRIDSGHQPMNSDPGSLAEILLESARRV